MRSRTARRAEAAALSTYRRLPPPLRRLLVRAVKPCYTVGAVLVVTRTPRGGATEVLLVRQRHTHGWALPGGLLDRGESPAQALVRELREELRLELDAGQLPPPTANVDPDPRRVDVVFRWEADLPDEPRRRGPEILEVGWHRLDALPALTGPTSQVLQLR
ncbi:MAG TPA: NUDIX domain-containing protein [Mycobacteriales bacterium]|nr:NUDIX domain-containing protein [Mycobacteriales bacterium]